MLKKISTRDSYHHQKPDDLTFWEACCNISSNAIQSIICQLFEFSIVVINIIFIGHQNNPYQLAGVGMGEFIIVIWLSISFGFNGAIDTLVSQAYGDTKYYLWGCYLNRCRILLFLISIPQLCFLYNVRYILTLMGQDEQTAIVAESYIFPLMFGLLFHIQFEATKRYLQAMEIFEISMWIYWVSTFIHLYLNYLFSIYFDLKAEGVGLATWITYIVQFWAIILYCSLKEDIFPEGCWHFFNKDSFKGWGIIIKYGIPSALMNILDWIAFGMLSMMSGWIGVEEQATWIVLINILGNFMMVHLGISYSACTLIGKSLGFGKPRSAQIYWISSLFLTLCISVFASMLMMQFPDYITSIYTQESNVIDLVNTIIPLFSLIIVIDSWQGVLIGSIKAWGYQDYGTVITLISYWLIMIPLAYIWAIAYSYRLAGLWIAVPLGGILNFIWFSLLLYKTDWAGLSAKVIDRIDEEITVFL